MAPRFLSPPPSETAAFAKQMMERSYQMAPLRRAAAAGSLVIDDYQKILFFFGKGGKRQFFTCEDLQSILY